MRVYLPVTPGQLAALAAGGELGPAPLLGFAVTPALREWCASGDHEELEYAAMNAAGRAAVDLLAASPDAADHDAAARRLVIAADVDAGTPDARHGPTAVLLPHAVPLDRVASVHADAEEAVADVAAAVRIVRTGGPRDGDEEFVLDSCAAHELAWYATQEIADLVD